MPDRALPPTSTFPGDPSELERAELEAVYLQLRNSYGSLMRSRGQFRGRAHRQGEEIRDQSLQTVQQGEQLRAVLDREARLKAETYAMLEAVTEVMEHLEDAGDALSNGFGAYQLGKRRPAAAAAMPQLMKGVLHFLNRWRLGKQRFQQLMLQRQSLNTLLEDGDGRDH